MTDATPFSGITFSELKPMMQAEIAQLAREWAPLGRRDGQYWVGPNPARGETKGTSFKIWLTGSAAGAWKEFDAGETEKGDIIDLPIYLGILRDKAAVREWAMARYGLIQADPKKLEQVRRETRAKADKAEADDARRKRAKIAMARRVWDEGQPLEPGATAWRYLKDVRRIAMDRLPRAVTGIRTSEALDWIAPDGTRAKIPAMIGAMCASDGSLMAVHRTYLDAETTGKVKAGPAKKMLGVTRGTAIRVWPGLDADAALVLTEGIEDALAIATSAPENACWAVGSLNGLSTFELPPEATCPRPACIIVFADNDWAGGPAARGFAQAMRRMATLGVPVSVARAHAGKDANDLLMRERTR